MTAPLPHLQHITVTQHGQDRAIFLNGYCVRTADPSAGDDPTLIDELAQALSQALNTPCHSVTWSPQEDWSWDDWTPEVAHGEAQ